MITSFIATLARPSVFVLVFGLAIYFYCVGFKKTSVSEVARIMIFCGLLAYLLAAGAKNC
jgi:hypothetical protein